jgi:hypothetical protein
MSEAVGTYTMVVDEAAQSIQQRHPVFVSDDAKQLLVETAERNAEDGGGFSYEQLVEKAEGQLAEGLAEMPPGSDLLEAEHLLAARRRKCRYFPFC